MSEWRVFVDKIEIFPHPNADKMDLGKVGTFQVVVGKGLYKTGDTVVFAPKRSVLPSDVRDYFRNSDTGKSYLKGPNEDRVGSIRLRGEESEGAILPPEWISKFKSLPMGEDISKTLGIEEYIPELHAVSGKRKSIGDGSMVMNVKEAVDLSRFCRHDCEQFRIFQKDFVPGEHVILTEKLHGSQISIMRDSGGRIAVTSKGRAEKNLVLREYPRIPLWRGRTFLEKVKNLYKKLFIKQPKTMNEYWRVARDSGIVDFLNEWDSEAEVQVIGEVVPFQQGFNYGRSTPTVKVFRVIVNTEEMRYGAFPDKLLWVPLLYDGPYDLEKILPLTKGKETVSGKSLHIKEGGVLSPVPLRKAGSTPLYVKIINEKFKDDNDELR